MLSRRALGVAAMAAALVVWRAGTACAAPAAGAWPESLDAGLRDLNQAMAYPPGNAEARLESLIDTHVDLGRFVERAFGQYVEKTLEDYGRVMSRSEMRDLATAQEGLLRSALRRRCATSDGWVERRIPGPSKPTPTGLFAMIAAI